MKGTENRKFARISIGKHWLWWAVAIVLVVGAFAYFLLPRFRYDAIVIHHSASEFDNYRTIRDSHQKTHGWRDAGYHLIFSNGKAGIPVGHLEATSRYRYLSYSLATKDVTCNVRGIHVCLVGNYESHSMPTSLRPAVAHAIRSLQQRYKIPDDRILFHGEDCSPSACPGKYMSKPSIRNWVAMLADQCADDVKQQQLGVIRNAGFSLYTLPWKMVAVLSFVIVVFVASFYVVYLWRYRQTERVDALYGGRTAKFLALGNVPPQEFGRPAPQAPICGGSPPGEPDQIAPLTLDFSHG